jgi:hypothetical protein
MHAYVASSAPHPPLPARDHCVALSGDCPSVAVMTSFTLSNRIEGGRPAHGSSISVAGKQQHQIGDLLPVIEPTGDAGGGRAA